MRHIEDSLEIQKVSGAYEANIYRKYIDNFGKEYIEKKLWDTYSTKEIAYRDINTEAMRNCGYKIALIDIPLI